MAKGLQKKAGEINLKNKIREEIVFAINNKLEFYYLEKLCEAKKIYFGDKIINHCLDRYVNLRKDGDDMFKSKYAAMFGTVLRIID